MIQKKCKGILWQGQTIMKLLKIESKAGKANACHFN